jgi:hypothetical protein
LKRGRDRKREEGRENEKKREREERREKERERQIEREGGGGLKIFCVQVFSSDTHSLSPS